MEVIVAIQLRVICASDSFATHGAIQICFDWLIVYAVLWSEKLKCFYRNNKMFCGIKSYNTCSSAVFRHWQVHNRFATGLLPCRAYYVVRSRLRNPLFRWQVCRVATVVMETKQLVLSHLKTFYPSQWTIEWGLQLCLCQKLLVNVVNWWSYVILIVAVRFFRHTVYHGNGNGSGNKSMGMEIELWDWEWLSIADF